MYSDQRLSSNHVSMYLSLFNFWNLNRFENPVPINRNEVMKAAKISSFSTYTKCLKQLHDWKYLEYIPSFNPLQGSRVNLYGFCTGECTGRCTGSCTESVQQEIQLSVQHPYINNINKYKQRETALAPIFDDVLLFFKDQKIQESEAKKFYNHYQSNGWLVGGKSPMKDWQAAAEKWISNSHNFKNHGTESKPKNGQLHTGNDKDYSEPL